MDDDFAHDIEEGIKARRQPWNLLLGLVLNSSVLIAAERLKLTAEQAAEMVRESGWRNPNRSLRLKQAIKIHDKGFVSRKSIADVGNFQTMGPLTPVIRSRCLTSLSITGLILSRLDLHNHSGKQL
jgi:hypothetical protein